MPAIHDPSLTSWQTATTAGPIVQVQDFEGVTDVTSIQVPMIVLAASYAPISINTTLTFGGVTFYHTGDKSPSTDGAAMRFMRGWSRKPASRTEYTEVAREFPGFSYEWGVQEFVAPRNEVTRARKTYSYYVEGVDVSSAADIPLSQAFQPVLSGTTYPVNLLGPSGFSSQTSPTAEVYLGYVASGTYLVQQDSIRRWKGGIYEREKVEFVAR